ncbi:polyprenyl diphosphate synthase [Actinomadura hibisca]|uniref:polyprenyl diphosphate synthase n=1 Tax=Actinomadura hibisca TaxID=68565 RepID=UPI0008335FF9|nr:polyprenyl diphosphate synthase [Actinomadura hibisca]
MTATAGPRAAQIPAHLGIIPDGNRRWARQAGVPVIEAHRRGAARTTQVLSWAEQAGVRAVTVWALSLDNLARAGEVDDMLAVIGELADAVAAIGRWRLRVLGDLTPLNGHALSTALDQAMHQTQDAQDMTVNLAVGYDGRHQILSAVADLLARGRPPTPEAVEDALAARGETPCDLIIRTSGEYRLSGFLLWHSARAELYFTDRLWPDFSQQDMDEALETYARRERRFGR